MKLMNQLFRDIDMRWERSNRRGKSLPHELTKKIHFELFQYRGLIVCRPKEFSVAEGDRMKRGAITIIPRVKTHGLVQERHPYQHRSGIFKAIKSCYAYGGIQQDEIVQNTKPKAPTVWTHLTIAVAEYLGTTTLIFLSCTGCAGIQGEQSSMHAIFAAGLAVTAVIQTFGHISAAHVNPAVSLGAIIVQQITWKQLPGYVVPQLLGSLTGSALFKTVSNQKHLLGEDGRGVCVNKIHSDISVGQGLVVEIILSIILNLANCASWDARNSDKGDSVSIRIGLLVTVLNLGGAAYTGASMNPARSFGPAVISGDFKDHWVYWIGPIIGSLIAATIYRTIFLRYQRK